MPFGEVASYTDENRRTAFYLKGWFVADEVSGRVGMIRNRWGRDSYNVQFGADGPFEACHGSQLWLATRTQVAHATGAMPREP